MQQVVGSVSLDNYAAVVSGAVAGAGNEAVFRWARTWKKSFCSLESEL